MISKFVVNTEHNKFRCVLAQFETETKLTFTRNRDGIVYDIFGGGDELWLTCYTRVPKGYKFFETIDEVIEFADKWIAMRRGELEREIQNVNAIQDKLMEFANDSKKKRDTPGTPGE